jgi:hypothetical protein
LPLEYVNNPGGISMKRLVSALALTLITSAAFAYDGPFVDYGGSATHGPFGNPDLDGLQYAATLREPTLRSQGDSIASISPSAYDGPFASKGPFGTPELGGLQYPSTLVSSSVKSGGPIAGNAVFADAGLVRNDGPFGNPDLDGLQYPATLASPAV